MRGRPACGNEFLTRRHIVRFSDLGPERECPRSARKPSGFLMSSWSQRQRVGGSAFSARAASV